MDKRKYYSLNALRGIAITFIFLSHLSYLKLNSKSEWLFNSIFSEGYLATTFFFIISGFFSIYSYKGENCFEFLKKKVEKLYPTFFIAMLSFVFMDFIIVFLSGREISIIKMLIKFICNIFLIQAYIPIKSIYFSFNAVAWFLSALMLSYYLTPIIIRNNKKWRIMVLISIGYVIGVTIISFSIKIDLHWILYINPFFRIIDFMIGILIFQFKDNINLKKMNFNILEIIAIMNFILFFVIHSYFPQNLRYDIYWLIPSIFIVFIFSFDYGIISKILKSRCLQKIGDNSYYFFIFHLIIINIITRFEIIIKYPVISIMILFLLCKYFADLYSCVYKKLLKRWNEKNENKLFKF